MQWNLGLDIGSRGVRMTVQGRGMALRESSAVAVKAKGGDFVALGDEALSYLGRAPRALDIGRFGPDRCFCYTASFGAFTSVSWSTPQNIKNVFGHAAHILEGIRSLADIHPIHMRITADGRIYEDDYIFGAICNSTSLGGILKLEHSEVHMNDGLFETLLIPFPPDLLVLNRILNALRTHHYDDPSLSFLRASSFIFEGAPDVTWTLDGEAADGSARTEIRNIRNAFRLVCT